MKSFTKIIKKVLKQEKIVKRIRQAIKRKILEMKKSVQIGQKRERVKFLKKEKLNFMKTRKL